MGRGQQKREAQFSRALSTFDFQRSPGGKEETTRSLIEPTIYYKVYCPLPCDFFNFDFKDF